MITSETFYRAECEAPNCGRTLPDEDTHEASHWPRSYVEEQLREPREVGLGDVEVTWFYDGEKTFCPEHHPGATPCGTCDGEGMVRVDGPPPNWEGQQWTFPHHWENCPECDRVGFHPAPESEGQESEHAARWDGRSRPHRCATCGGRIASRLESWVHLSTGQEHS
ncbi:hypothetical protein LJR045_000965 [Microbacterium sp. LjRoot45]|uniref:hypothetical protein n=1 Tax=Microbacterium sp. LjRoot45 TaxID=3342329 RepID=UPI003ED015B0